jgi:hypothetical protein
MDKGVFLQHNLGRFSEPMEGHGGPFIIVPIIILLGLLPASIFIGESFKKFRTTFKQFLFKTCTLCWWDFRRVLQYQQHQTPKLCNAMLCFCCNIAW